MLKDGQELRKSLIGFSLLDLVTLQHLYTNLSPILRYRLMKEVFNALQLESIPPSKFYRALERLHRHKLVDYKVINGQQQYFITQKGVVAVTNARSVIGNIGVNVINYFQPFMQSIVEFVTDSRQVDRCLFIDFPQLYDRALLDTIIEHVKELELLVASDEDIPKLSIERLSIVLEKDRKIQAADASYDAIILFYPSHGAYLMETEVLRTLKKGGRLIIVDAELPNTNHFIVDILLTYFWPLRLDQRKSLAELISQYRNAISWTHSDSIKVKGLHLHKFQK